VTIHLQTSTHGRNAESFTESVMADTFTQWVRRAYSTSAYRLAARPVDFGN